jgi:hypothetical protein
MSQLLRSAEDIPVGEVTQQLDLPLIALSDVLITKMSNLLPPNRFTLRHVLALIAQKN